MAAVQEGQAQTAEQALGNLQIFATVVGAKLGADLKGLNPGDYTPLLQKKFATLEDKELARIKTSLLEDREVAIGAKDTKSWAKFFNLISSAEIAYFLLEACEFAAELATKDPEFKAWFDDFTANIQPKLPQETRAILSVYFIFEDLRKRQESQSETAVGTVGAFVITDAMIQPTIQLAEAYVLMNKTAFTPEKIVADLERFAAVLTKDVAGAKQTAAKAAKEIEVLELLAKTGASLSSALRFSVCAAGWMTEFLKSCKRNEVIVHCGTLGLADLLKEVRGIEGETKAYGERIISYYKSQHEGVTDDQLQSVKLKIETWTGE